MFTQRDDLREAFEKRRSDDTHNTRSRDFFNKSMLSALLAAVALYVFIPLFGGLYTSLEEVSGHIMPIITLFAGFFGGAVSYYYTSKKEK